MMKLPVGVIIKSIVDEKRIKVADIANKMGMTRQAIYYSYAKEEMSDGELSRWASVLGIPEGEIQSRWNNALNEISSASKPDDNSYLLDHLASLEEQFKRLLNQIEVKDRQIEGLQETVKVLLGKSEDVTILMTTLAPPNQSKISAAMA